jgi:hypothetical protein
LYKLLSRKIGYGAIHHPSKFKTQKRVPHPSFLRRVGGFVEAPGVIPLCPIDRGVAIQNDRTTPALPSAGTEKFSMSRFVGHGFSRAKKNAFRPISFCAAP